ncbi:MAG: ABC transporter ATP-binding protein [Candidatus Coprovivens sp.]
MPRPGGPKVQEKSKDFFGSMKRLLINLKPWKYLMSIALVLAMISAILSLIAPNKLSDLADLIAEGLVPKTDKFALINDKMMSNFNEDNMKEKMYIISSSESISEDDKKIYMKTMQEMQSINSEEDKLQMFLSLPTSILKVMFDEIEIDGIKISVDDQIETIALMTKMGFNNDTENGLELLNQLPESVYSIVEPEMNTVKIKNLIIFMICLYVISSLFSYIQSLSMVTVSNRFAQKLRSSISDKINKLPLKYFDSHETGDVLSIVTNDIDTIGQNLNNSLSTLVSSVTLFIGSIIMMFYTNWVMALTAIISSLIGFLSMGKILGKSQKYFAQSQEALGNLNGYIEEIYSGHNVVKSYNGVKDALVDFDKLNNELYEAKRKSIFMSGTMQPLMGFVGNLGYVAVCIVGALLSIKGYISFGVIVAFMIYVRLFTNPLSQIAQALTNLQSTAAASERVFEFLDEKEMSDQKDIDTHLDSTKVSGDITFNHVKFGYDENRTIIKDFSVNVKKGQKVAIVGPTGAGKTTMVNLLMKFYEINDGDITIDGVSTKKLSRENIHDLFCMVLQDTWLFDGTIRDNIKFNKSEISDKEIWDALKVVGIDHFVKTLPGGLDATIGDSDTVSQGQKQLFTIARGMLENAPFLILDEATSNVDTRTEELVQKAMDKLTEGRTSFIIAHRLSTIKNADMILVMNEGNIIEQGTHEELMKQKGFYEKLYNSQFEKVT